LGTYYNWGGTKLYTTVERKTLTHYLREVKDDFLQMRTIRIWTPSQVRGCPM
jgi:hypothetical protein